MTNSEPVVLNDRFTRTDGSALMSGVQALIRLPFDLRRHDLALGRKTAGFISGYEGSPLGGYDLALAKLGRQLEAADIIFKPGLNEELAVNAVQGSQLVALADDRKYDGITALWYGKAPGLDRASDAVRHANLGGVGDLGGVLVLVGDDSIAKSSTIPSSSEIALAELGLPTLSPSNPQDILELGVHGIELSRFSGLWVGMKIATNVADGSQTVELSPPHIQPVTPSREIDGKPFTHTVTAEFLQPKLTELEHTLLVERIELARRYIAANALNTVHHRSADDVVGIVVPGSNYLDVKQALADMDLDDENLDTSRVRILKLNVVYPLIEQEIVDFADGLSEIVVIEEKRSFVESAVKDVLYGRPGAPAVSGKSDPSGAPLLRAQADLTPDLMTVALHARISTHVPLDSAATEAVDSSAALPRRRVMLPLLARTPYFCSGCPHNVSTRVPEGSIVGAGIGCHGLVGIMPEERVGNIIGLTQMGGEGTTWIGMSPFVDSRHMIQNMGDGTFHHSGSLAIRAAIAAEINVTYKILYNSAVAMTGGQTPMGGMTVAEMTRMLQAEGVAKIVITADEPERYRQIKLPRGVDVRGRDDLIGVQEELAKVPGVTIMIHDQECATELRRKRKRKLVATPTEHAFINERVCEGCGDCGEKSNCLSVQPVNTDHGRKTQIHQASCNLDMTCLSGDCPSFLTVTPGSTKAGAASVAIAPDIEPAILPEPESIVVRDGFGMRITGIGGTGVVTVGQILATAATFSGRFVQTLDQTGLAQKGGAVVSDIKLTDAPAERANKVGTGQADLYLGCDLLVAASDTNLSVAHGQRTVAVISTAEVPTGAMVTDTSVLFPAPDDTLGRISLRTRRDTNQFIDSRSLTQSLFDDDQFSNLFLVGVAYQLGALPIESENIERAIVLNGVAVDKNIQAFRRGRQLISDPDALHSTIAGLNPSQEQHAPDPRVLAMADSVGATPGTSLADLLRDRTADLVSYQNLAYAKTYVDIVRDARDRLGGIARADELTEVIARHLFKLMAYKDEYEVARLSLDPALDAALVAEFGPGYKAQYRLHPPILRAMGMKKKISLGRWFRPFFAMLYAMRKVRGTRLDFFGYAKVRRVERALITEYVSVIDEVVGHVRATSEVELALEICALPDMVRGYEHIKLDNVDLYHARLTELRGPLAVPGQPVPTPIA